MATKKQLDTEAERQLTQGVGVRLLSHNNTELEGGSLFGTDRGHRRASCHLLGQGDDGGD